MKSKSTKRALLASVLSMMLCCAMLIGTTFAWFTDSVTSGANKITAGNLDVELYHANGSISEEKVTETTKLFVNKDGGEIKWEPGVMVYENFTVKNEGSLALKYRLNLNIAGFNTVKDTEKSLKDVLKVAILDGAFSGERTDVQALDFNKTVADFEKEGTLTAGENSSAAYAVVIYWEPSANDNDYNLNNGRESSDGNPLFIDLGINLLATQDTVESDSFGNQYDKDAAYPTVLPHGVTAETFADNNAVAYAGDTYYATLKSAVEAGNGVIYLSPDAKLTEIMTHAHVTGDLTIYGNGASLVGGGEHDLEIDTYNTAKLPGIVDDVTINIYNLDRIAVWGQRTTDYTVNVNLFNCHDIERIYISGAKGINNISLTNCSASSLGTACKLYSNAAGNITVTNCSYNMVQEPINLNNKSNGIQNICIKNCTFTDCSIEDILKDNKAWAAPIRVIAAGENAVSNLTLENNSFIYSDGKAAFNGDILTEELREDKKDEIKGEVVIINN